MELTLNDVKKLLYKHKPSATFVAANKYNLCYHSQIEGLEGRTLCITFAVPLADIGDAIFTKNIDAQLLIRYISLFYADFAY